MRSVNGSSLGAELIARLVRMDVRIAAEDGFSKGCPMRKQPRLLFSRGNCGSLDLTNYGELVLDCEVGDQYPYGLASIT